MQTTMATKQSYEAITNKIIHTAVLTPNGSKTFVKKIIPTAIASILFKRTNLNRNDFIECNYNGTPYEIFGRNINTPIIKLIILWIKGAIDALDKNYLRELYLIFADKNDVNNVLESYKFQIKYIVEDIVRLDPKPTENMLQNSATELLNAVNDIRSYSDILNENEFLPYIYLTYYDDVVPDNYEPPYFCIPEADLEKTIDNVCSMAKKNQFRLSLFDTGFHKIKCHGVNQMFDMDQLFRSAHTSDSEISLKENTPSVILVKGDSEIIDLTSEEVDNTNIECKCSLNKKFDNISLITCSRCSHAEHVPCVGYLYLHNIVKPYVCQNCKAEGIATLSTPGDVKRHNILSIFNLIVSYMHFNQTFPSIILNEASERIRNHIMKKLFIINVITKTDTGILINKDVLDLVIPTKFSDSKQDEIVTISESDSEVEEVIVTARKRSLPTQEFAKKTKHFKNNT